MYTPLFINENVELFSRANLKEVIVDSNTNIWI